MIRQIHPPELPAFLFEPSNARLFREGVESMGRRFTVADVTQLLLESHMQLWAASDGTGIVLSEIVAFPQERVLRLFGLAGSDIRNLAKLLPVIKAWGAENGCSEAEAIETRPGLEAVIPEFKRAGVCLVMPINSIEAAA
jgi:hypothetical protein